MKLLFSIILVIIFFSAPAQPYQAGRRSVTFIDTSRNNRSIATELFYPAAAAGNNVPLANGTEKFPVVVFGHGFVIAYSSYNWLADSLVKNGYIVAMPTTEGSFSPAHEQFGKDIAFLSSYIISLNDSSSSFLLGRVKNRSAVGGHSMGGGASFLAADYNNGINAVFNFAAAETNPSAKEAALQTTIPALIFAGSSDCIVPDTNQQRMYSNVPYACKTFVNITDALHCHFANNNGTCATGQIFSGCNSSSITAAIVFQKTANLLIPFLDYYLKDSCSSKTIFENRLTAMTGIVKERNCTTDPFICNATNIYIFTGSGNWDVAVNWSNNIIPPSPLPSGSEIIINPAGNSSCILNIAQTIAPGGKLTVATGKNFLLQGNLTVQEGGMVSFGPEAPYRE